MNLYKRMKTDFSHEDDRGTLIQLAHEGYEQVNVLVSKAGVSRGRHYHKETAEAFFVVEGETTVDFERNGERQTDIFRKGEFFRVFPWVRHTLRFETDAILVALYEHSVERADGTKDIYND